MERSEIKPYIAKRVAKELHDGDVVNLGIGLPTMVPDYLDPSVKLTLQSENGFIGLAAVDPEDPDAAYIVNAGGQPAGIEKDGMFFDSATSFSIIRGGHVDATILGSLQVDEKGNIANWIIPGKMVPGMGGAMDLVVGAKRVIVAMEHTQKGAPKILKECTLPLTAEAQVNLIVTEMGVMEVTPEGIRFEVPFSIHSHGEAITFTIEKGSDGEVSVRSQSSSVQFVDYGKNRKNIQKLRETMEEIKASLTPEELAQRAKDFEEEFNRPLTEEEKAYIEEEKKRNSFLSFFIPRKGFIATPILIDINILVFIVMIASGVGIMSPSTLSLLKWGADFGPLTLTGDWWRTVTCNFIHIGAFHLLMNMYAFMYVGLLLEELIGGRRMFVSYLLTGLCSAAFSLYMHGETISAGASGSIFGLYGIFLAFLLFHRIAKEQRKALLTSILIFVGYNLVYGMKAGIDNAAHIGGLLSGFVLGIIYVVGYKFEKPDAQRTVSIIGELGIFCIFLFSFMILCKNVPPLYPEIRNEWESGIVEAYLNGELEEENENSNHSAVNATDNLSSRKVPAYTPVGNDDTWLSYYDAATKFSCQYPTNWIKIAGAKGIIDGAEPPLLMLVNGGNQLTITALTYDTQKEFEHMKELSLTLPRNAQGEPSEDYQLSNVNINGLPMTKITNPLHIGAPDEPGEDVKQIALHYFQESKKRSFAIVMLVYDEEAETDLNAITSSIQITQ